MTAEQKRVFIAELIANVQADIVAAVDRMPEEWDGHELRRYIADKFEDSAMTVGQDKSFAKRLRAYRNEVIVRNL